VSPDPDDVRRQWAERSGEFSPAYYAHRGPDATSERVRRLLEDAVGRDARVLEVGCSAGRHLAHLHDAGFSRLSGVEVNPEAFAVMCETYPALAEAGSFHRGTAEDLVAGFAADAFDATFSVETLQHVHPDSDRLFGEVVRVTDDIVVTVENEPETAADGVNYVDDDVPLYYRDWHDVFTDLGLAEVAAVEGDRDTTRAFRPPDRTAE
jgi:SAM-dependent methyltransferase